MSLNFQFSIPTDQEKADFELAPGNSLIFVGANGGGKTRLAVQIEEALRLRAHRISAHRALTLNPDVAKISEKKALMGLAPGMPPRMPSYNTEMDLGGKAKVLYNCSMILIIWFKYYLRNSQILH